VAQSEWLNAAVNRSAVFEVVSVRRLAADRLNIVQVRANK
jgi:hypothetical protein